MRGIEYLVPEAPEKATQLVALCVRNGLRVKITDTLRTKEEQDALFNKRPKVTNVQYPNSMHCWGIAFDFCRNDGKSAYDNSDGFFDKVGALGKSLGLEWGGDWKSIVDKPHLQLKQYGSTPKLLKSQYGTPDVFMKKNVAKSQETHYLKCQAVKRGSRGRDVMILQAFLGCDVDGIAGLKTCDAIEQFQTKYKLNPDGICGVKTWQKIANIMTGTE